MWFIFLIISFVVLLHLGFILLLIEIIRYLWKEKLQRTLVIVNENFLKAWGLGVLTMIGINIIVAGYHILNSSELTSVANFSTGYTLAPLSGFVANTFLGLFMAIFVGSWIENLIKSSSEESDMSWQANIVGYIIFVILNIILVWGSKNIDPLVGSIIQFLIFSLLIGIALQLVWSWKLKYYWEKYKSS